MFRTESGLSISATDVAHFLNCRHLIALDLGAIEKRHDKPRKKDDPLVDLVVQRGMEHEKAFVDSLRQAGREVVTIPKSTPEQAVVDTLTAIKDGAEVIVQGALRHDQWFGYTDILMRVDAPSALGSWSYEVADTKLARETRAGTIMQLGVYTSMLAQVLQTSPERFHVVVPGEQGATVQHTYRADDYSAYLRFMQRELQSAIATGYEALAETYYPEPVEHCAVCAWWRRCNDRRHADDHLSLVPGLGRLHRRELVRHDIDSVAKLAAMVLPSPTFKPARGSRESYQRAHEQALVQITSRGLDVPRHTLRPVPVGKPDEPQRPYGLSRLPEPSPGDVFLDLEGDLFADDVGREYLFGIATVSDDGRPQYQAWWAITMREERQAFESVMDFIMERLERFPAMHVYHYAPYEPSAFKRLMGRHGVREAELDRLLRGGRFIDLYAIVKQAMWIGVESYSIKQLEPCFGYQRDVNLPDASHALRRMEYALQTRRPEIVPDEDRRVIEGYNRDDCMSTLRLRDWLEQVRSDAVASGMPCARPPEVPEQPSEQVTEKSLRVQELRARLLADVPDEGRTQEQQARWILAYLLDYHRREDKATWWEYFRLRDLPVEDLADERKAVVGLEFVEQVSSGTGFHKNGNPKGPIVDRYRYPEQEVEFSRGDKLRTTGEGGSSFGTVVKHDRKARTLDLDKSRKKDGVHPHALFAFDYVPSEEAEKALLRLGEEVAAAGTVSAVSSAAAELLLANAPRLDAGAVFAQAAGETATEFAVRVAPLLDQSLLAIQGPPGSGKTYTGSEMICALVRQGKRVGVTANSHKVIRNLLDKCLEKAAEKRVTIRVGHKNDQDQDESAVVALKGNETPLNGLRSGELDVVGGTAWLWSREEYQNAVDVLFVDEAGQMALANVAAVSQAANSLVLLGDPQQLDQPTQGTHPDGVGLSALEHLLGGQQTITNDRGIFLPTTWRLAPAICRFTSEMYYERKLASRPGLEHQELVNAGEWSGSGLRMIGVEHDGNRNHSPEEVAAVVDLVARLTSSVQWRDDKGALKPLQLENLLVVSPYNAQVNHLLEALPADARVGTVDKFQGQQAPVVIYSMATSRPEDAPRGMEFLYSLNRFNVATSRAQCAVFVVASPHLFAPECRTVRQIKLANGLCRYRELATSLDQ